LVRGISMRGAEYRGAAQARVVRRAARVKPGCERPGLRSKLSRAASGRLSMHVRLQKDLVVLSPGENEAQKLGDWLRTHAGQVFRLENAGGAAVLHAIWPADEARRQPINI